MDKKSSRNQEIRPIADFTDRAMPFRDSPAANGHDVGSRSLNQEIHPFADFRNTAQPLNEDKTAAGDPHPRVDFVIDADIAPFFPTNASVNDALRKWLDIAGLDGNPNTAQ